MEKKAREKLPEYLTTTEVAVLLGLTSRRIQQLVQDGIIKRDDELSNKQRKFKSSEVIVGYINYLQTENDDDEMTMLRKKKLKYEIDIKQSAAKMNEIKLNEYRGRMHSAEDVRDFTTDMVMTIRGDLMAMPSRLAVDIAKETNPNVVRDMIKSEVNSILIELSNYEYNPEKYKERLLEREKLETVDLDED